MIKTVLTEELSGQQEAKKGLSDFNKGVKDVCNGSAVALTKSVKISTGMKHSCRTI